MRRFFPRLSLLMLLLTSCTAPTVPATLPVATASTIPTTATATPAPREFRIVAYVTESIIESIIPYDKLTHINYSFITPNADGTFNPVPNSFKLKNIVGMARQFNVKVLIAVGGWGWDAQFETVAADPKLRSAFVQNLKAVVDEFQLDGFDMDWEYPDEGESAQNFLTLMQELRAAMPDKLITTAVVAYGANGNGILPEVFALVDFVNVMTYDGPDHGTLEQFEKGLAFWTARGVPQDKLVMGLPFYGDPDMPYRKLVDQDPAAAQLDTFEYFSLTYHYNGIPTVQAKTRIAMDQAGGIMFWTLDYDIQGEYSLVNAIYQTANP